MQNLFQVWKDNNNHLGSYGDDNCFMVQGEAIIPLIDYSGNFPEGTRPAKVNVLSIDPGRATVITVNFLEPIFVGKDLGTIESGMKGTLYLNGNEGHFKFNDVEALLDGEDDSDFD